MSPVETDPPVVDPPPAASIFDLNQMAENALTDLTTAEADNTRLYDAAQQAIADSKAATADVATKTAAVQAAGRALANAVAIRYRLTAPA